MMYDRPEYCPCRSEELDPTCPACGATVAGNDPHHGVCQARRNGPPPQPLIAIVLKDKLTDEIVASTDWRVCGRRPYDDQ